MSDQSKPPKSCGAQKGNFNALKHGRYSSRLRDIIAASPRLPDPHSLRQEIVLMRSMVWKLFGIFQQSRTFEQKSQAFQSCCQACLTLIHLLETEKVINHPSAGSSLNIGTDLSSLLQEWDDDDPVC